MVNVTIVPSASAIGAGSMSSTAPPWHETRAGGRCTAPLSRSREPTNPYFHRRCGPRPTAEIRAGSGRRGGSSGHHAAATTRNLP